MNLQINTHELLLPGPVSSPAGPSMLLRKSNRLVNSRNSLTAVQHRVLLLMLAAQKSAKESLGWLEIPIHKVIDITGKKMAQGGQYRQVRESVANMQQKPVCVPDESGQWKALRMIQLDTKTSKGVIRLRFTDTPDTRQLVCPSFEKGSAGYTSYKLGVACRFRKKYSLRIYEKLKRATNQQHKDRLTVSLSLSMLRYEFCLEDKYTNNSDFKRWVIDPAIEEINRLSDLTASYRFDRHYSPSQISFSVARKESKNKEQQPKPKSDPKPEITQGEAFAPLYGRHGKDYVDFCWNQVQKKPNIQNPTAYLKKALQENYFSEEYKLRKARDNKQQEVETLRTAKLQIEELFKVSYDEQIAKALNQISEEQKQHYIADRLASHNHVWRKYAREVEKGNPSHKARVNLAVWYIQKYGTPQQKELLDIQGFSKKHIGIDWQQINSS